MPLISKCRPFVMGLVCVAALSVSGFSYADDRTPAEQSKDTEVWSPVPPVVTLSKENVPSDAIILFDGKNTQAWEDLKAAPVTWQIDKGALVVAVGSGDIRTKESFCDVQLHIEWMTPLKITDDKGKLLQGQGRNNSGIFFQGLYELQVLDSFDNITYPNGQAGAIYKQSIPLVNVSRAPGNWQAYDMIYKAPQFDTDGTLMSPARITVLQNGVLIQNDFAIKGPTQWIGRPPYKAHGCAPLILQEHGQAIKYRNIWIRKL